MKPFPILVLALTVASASANAQEHCGLCARSVVITADLAGCFLKRFAEWQSKSSAAIVVDLSTCEGAPSEEQRGIVAALPTPGQAATLPDTQFIVTLGQLVCLKRKLEDPALVLDPSATINLAACE